MSESQSGSSDVPKKRSRWRRIFRGLGVFFLLLLLVYWSGPRVEVEGTLDRMNDATLKKIQSNVEQYLVESESKPLINSSAKIDPDLKKKIVWAGEKNQKTRYSIVYLHGFSASHQDLMPVPEILAKHLKANIFFSRLTAHGYEDEILASKAFEKVTATDWLNDVNEAVEIGRVLGEEVILVGMSTGGTLALWKANRDSQDIAAVVLLSPNLGVANRLAPLVRGPWGKTIAQWNYGDERDISDPEKKNEQFMKCWTTKHHPNSLSELSALVSFCTAEEYSQFQLPCLCVYSENDDLLDIPHLREFFAHEIGNSATANKRIHDLGSRIGHCLAGDILCEYEGLTPEQNPNQDLVGHHQGLLGPTSEGGVAVLNLWCTRVH